MAEKSSLRGEAKMPPPQASGKRREFDPLEVNCICYIKCLIPGGERWIRTRGISRRIAYRSVRDSRTTKIGHSDFGLGDGSAFAMRCPRCRAFPHCRTPRLDPVTAARRQRRVLATA